MSEPVRSPEPRRPWPVWAMVALTLLLSGWGLWHTLLPGDARARASTLERQVRAQQTQIEQLQQRLATVSRSDQISREANRDLQGALAERDEEIAALRADIAFYERLVGATGQRRGLTVHALRLQRQGDAWHFTATLTQNLNRGAISRGQLSLAVEGTQGGRLQRLEWADLRQQPQAAGLPFSFKYFQQVEGDLVLPPGLTPVRVTVRLAPQSGGPVEQSFTWAEASVRDAAGLLR
ncbi:MAG TPA: DUF6776 family protein [Lysobacter sp.]|nr:DUF6776 family protein [Lysobacter sp.]